MGTSVSPWLVVEKDAVFNKLAQERIFDTLPVVLVTAKAPPRRCRPPRHRHAIPTLES
jgi:DNA topoisomerase VI subunit A